MSTHKLKSVVQRGTMFGAAFALAASVFAPLAPSTYADALNPLTDRSLTLSSSAPGWDYLDGSGNATYAPPNSGANGQKVGNTFDFKVSTDTEVGATKVKGFSFQYCTSPAGECTAPGNNNYTETTPGVFDRNPNGASESAAQRSDLEVVIAGGAGTSQATLTDHLADTSAATNPDGVVSSVPLPGVTGGKNFLVYYLNGTTWTASAGWTMAVANKESGVESAGTAGDPIATGKNNYITLTNSAGQGFAAGTRVKIVFFATNTNYITNPGNGAFFVRMNTYSSDSALTDLNVIDGGVTVANVMNLGIQITTKVLETMDFSVGTVDPYTLQAIADNVATTEVNEAEGSQLYAATARTTHGVCEPIRTKMDMDDPLEPANRLQLGDPTAEYSLRTDTTYSTHSYWRLSSNSSAGATVYYSGNTLTNTVSDEIAPIGTTAANPHAGSEQFGLALANGTIAANDPADLNFATGVSVHGVNYNVEREPVDSGNYGVFENGADNAANGLANPLNAGIDPSVTSAAVSNLGANASWHTPRLYPLVPSEQYDAGAGNVNLSYGSITGTKFAFDPTSMLIPVELASQDNQVVNCVTGKMRYIANIAATTPAGIYTTKINYIAAPQY